MHVCFVSISRPSICFVSICTCEYTGMFYEHLSCEHTCICFVCEFLIV